MTFKKFEELFKTKYPEGEVLRHGGMGQTRTTGQASVIFKPDGKVYDYYGAYEDILCRIGIKVISKARVRHAEQALERYRKDHNTPKLFADQGNYDFSEQIAELEDWLDKIYAEYIIV